MNDKKYYFKHGDMIFNCDNVFFVRCDNYGTPSQDGDRIKICDSGYNLLPNCENKEILEIYFQNFIDEIFEKMQQTNFIDIGKISQHCRDKLKNIDVDMSTE